MFHCLQLHKYELQDFEFTTKQYDEYCIYIQHVFNINSCKYIERQESFNFQIYNQASFS